MTASTSSLAGRAAAGLSLGFSLSFIGFGDFAEVHRMFVFADLRLFLTFGCAVLLTALGYRALKGRRAVAPRPLHRGVVPGAVMFGAGWAICGACPGITLVQLGEGRLFAVLTLAGIVSGNWACRELHARYLRWDAQSCAE